MEYRKLISPEFRISLENYELSDGIEVECFSSLESKADWCKVELTTQLQGKILFNDMEQATVELGYDGDYDILIPGYVRKIRKDYWKEIFIKDDMIKLERVEIKASFEKCEPQDIIKYILCQAGIERYTLSEEKYGKKDIFIVNKQNGIKAIMEINSAWGISNDFFFQNRTFYWGTRPEQEYVYVLEENLNILSLKKYGELWEIETFGVPWIHHSNQIEVVHSKIAGDFIVDKTIVKSDSSGRTRMYIYFKGG